jgi:hypothetical protein
MDRENSDAAHPAYRSSVVERRFVSDVAAQSRLGILPERRPGLGSRNPAHTVADGENLSRI